MQMNVPSSGEDTDADWVVQCLRSITQRRKKLEEIRALGPRGACRVTSHRVYVLDGMGNGNGGQIHVLRRRGAIGSSTPNRPQAGPAGDCFLTKRIQELRPDCSARRRPLALPAGQYGNSPWQRARRASPSAQVAPSKGQHDVTSTIGSGAHRPVFRQACCFTLEP